MTDDAPALIIDGNNLLMRCVKAMEYSGLRNGGHSPTGPFTAFIGALGRVVREVDPARVVVCWDHGPSRYRTELFANYKAARKQAPDPAAEERKDSAFAMAKNFLTLCRIQQVAVPEFEADDVVAAYWQRIGLHPIVIFSGDKDFLQLVGPNPHGAHTIQLRPDNAGGYEHWDSNRIYMEYGCFPHDLPMYFALVGDQADGIPGVYGIGPKKALKALSDAGWDLNAVKALEDQEKQQAALTSYDLVNLRTPAVAPVVPDLKPFQPLHYSDGGAACMPFVTFMRALEMDQALNRFHTGTLWS
jgi:DNA polymerase-1